MSTGVLSTLRVLSGSASCSARALVG